MGNKTIITLEIEGRITETNRAELNEILEGMLQALKEREPMLISSSQEDHSTIVYGRYMKPSKFPGGRTDKFHIVM